MVRLKATVSYDGSHYQGFQSQHHGKTIQDELQLALTKVNKSFVQIHGSGRTDAKAHALGQTFHFDPTVIIGVESWKKALNRVLPADIHIREVAEASPDFHARHDAIKKEYAYYINQGAHNPFQVHYQYQLRQKLQFEKMQEALQMFLGTHDFKNFCSNADHEMNSFVRTIFEATLEEENEILCFRFVGNGFLRYMVRFLVGAIVAIGRGKMSIEQCKALLMAEKRETIAYKVPALGLYLVRVEYREGSPKGDVTNES